jgi:hypothetical protein
MFSGTRFEGVNPWVDLVNYFRDVPMEEKTVVFSLRAEELFKNSLFNSSVQDIFYRAVRKDPTKFSHRSLRRYLNIYNDGRMAVIYWRRYENIVSTNDKLESMDQRVWSIWCALSMVAVGFDIAETGKEQADAKEKMRKFCREVVFKFPNLPPQLTTILYAAKKSGIFTEKEPRFQTASVAALEKGDHPKSVIPIVRKKKAEKGTKVQPLPIVEVKEERPMPGQPRDIFSPVRGPELLADPWSGALSALRSSLPQAAQAS